MSIGVRRLIVDLKNNSAWTFFAVVGEHKVHDINYNMEFSPLVILCVLYRDLEEAMYSTMYTHTVVYILKVHVYEIK